TRQRGRGPVREHPRGGPDGRRRDPRDGIQGREGARSPPRREAPDRSRALRLPDPRPSPSTSVADREPPRWSRDRIGGRLRDRPTNGGSIPGTHGVREAPRRPGPRDLGYPTPLARPSPRFPMERLPTGGCELVEINPLAIVGEGLVALDAKVIIEDDAGYRHPEYAEIRDDRTELEEIAR